jgi:hypothetical protein
MTAAEMGHTADEYYENLLAGITAADLNKWQQEIEQAEQDRMQDRSVMDIMGAVRPTTGPPVVPLASRPVDDSVLGWIQLAIDVQEKQ